ncbi:101 kDa malaria antigen-like isoform X2 [Penaeus japonicus]|uniref:101 kDa malaria antigen-like isoform X2 n=1 Tax=Penaeus japonicus TaxID=27405 RepID=UPI001C70EEBF|nr:101 kDa malaria antigen-like isoform X2 [Penaeus japonicus]
MDHAASRLLHLIKLILALSKAEEHGCRDCSASVGAGEMAVESYVRLVSKLMEYRKAVEEVGGGKGKGEESEGKQKEKKKQKQKDEEKVKERMVMEREKEEEEEKDGDDERDFKGIRKAEEEEKEMKEDFKGSDSIKGCVSRLKDLREAN